MPRTRRIGIQIDHADPYWVQVGEAIRRPARSHSAEVVEVAIQEPMLLSVDEQIEAVEGLLVQELDALLCNTFPPSLLARILERGLPVIHVSELRLRHPLLTSRTGLYDAARLLGEFLDARLPPEAHILVLGGHDEEGDTGASRLAGFRTGLAPARLPRLVEVSSGWLYEQGRAALERHLDACSEEPFDALFGLSDSLALAALDVCQARCCLAADAAVVGVNGDPLALAAISAGQMLATVETDVDDMAAQALGLALQAARSEPLPPLFACRQRLITAENVAEAATRKLISLAGLPSRLIEDRRRYEQQRLIQAETSIAIDRKVGLLLNEQRLAEAITSLIRDSYGFDRARYLPVDPEHGRLSAPEDSAPLAYALAHNQLVFIPDTATSHRFDPDPAWPDARSRVVVPVRLGGQLIGLLDLHRRRVTHHTREELAGLQLLADRFGITVRNAQLYGHEQAARALAEQADRIKTTLLANVSHELRTPLNVILGYSRGALDALAYGEPAPADLADDLGQIYRSGEHLLRLINDLLDLSRAEIGELDLLPELIAPVPLLRELFQSSAESFGAGEGVSWRLLLPPELPLIEADPVRLRQILLNLLHNAHKFTARGTIILGAEVAGDDLHLWVADTGPGIAPELQERIFEPFVSGDSGAQGGIGLGLSITRRLVTLHRGRLSVDSAVGQGTTFHLYFPLATPTPAENPRRQDPTRVLLKPLGDAALLDAVSDLEAGPAGGTILIVEDDPAIRSYHRRLLATHVPECRICEAGNGREALAAVAECVPTLILLDLVMPELDGFGVLEALRSDRRTAAVPVLILSGKTLTADDIRRLAEARAVFEPKELLSDDELAAALRRALHSDEQLPAPTSALVKQAIGVIQQHYTEPLSRQVIADTIGVNKDYLGRIFQQEVGLSPGEYLVRHRLLRAKELLRTTDLPIATVAAQVGFDTATYFSQVFSREIGCSPRIYRARERR